MDSHWIEVVGYGGTAATFASYSMRTIIPLRVAGIAGSFFFIIYGLLISSWPMLATELTILPLNCWRLYQLLRLMRQVDHATGNELSVEWLDSFSKIQRHAPGDILFRAGDIADHLLIVHSGRFVLTERNIAIGPGDLVGEMGFLAPDNRRSMTLQCVEAGTSGRVSYPDLKQLYFQNPKFGFYLMRLMAKRMYDNLDHAKATSAANARLPADA